MCHMSGSRILIMGKKKKPIKEKLVNTLEQKQSILAQNKKLEEGG